MQGEAAAGGRAGEGPALSREQSRVCAPADLPCLACSCLPACLPSVLDAGCGLGGCRAGSLLRRSCTCPAWLGAAIRDGATRVVVRSGRVRDPPAQLSAVWRLEAAGAAGALDAPAGSDQASEAEALLAGAPQDAAAQAEERAARLAMRRFARDVGAAAVQQPQRQPVAACRRPAGRPRNSGAATSQRKVRGQRAAGSSGAVLKQAGNVRGPPAAPGELSSCRMVPGWAACYTSFFHAYRAIGKPSSRCRQRGCMRHLCRPSPHMPDPPHLNGPAPLFAGVRRVPSCVWCGSSDFLMLGCASCPRCFCFKCFQRRPGLGINNWSRAGAEEGRGRRRGGRGREGACAAAWSGLPLLPPCWRLPLWRRLRRPTASHSTRCSQGLALPLCHLPRPGSRGRALRQHRGRPAGGRRGRRHLAAARPPSCAATAPRHRCAAAG